MAVDTGRLHDHRRGEAQVILAVKGLDAVKGLAGIGLQVLQGHYLEIVQVPVRAPRERLAAVQAKGRVATSLLEELAELD